MINSSTILALLGNQADNTTLLIEQQTTEDIMQAMLAKHEQCQADYDKFSYLFDVGTVYDICQCLFNFCKRNLAYRVEKTKAQYISKPYTILARGYSDCKGYALFCAGVLDSLRRKGKRVDWAFRFASYKLFKKEPYHVFVTVKDASGPSSLIYLDPVFDVFNYKRIPMWRQDYSGKLFGKKPAQVAGMQVGQGGRLNVLSDCDCMEDDTWLGATTSQTGTSIMKLTGAAAPYLATVPVVGWIAIGVGSLAGGLLSILGDKHNQSSSVLWLVQLYQEKVLGQTGVTASNANDALTPQAQAWFSLVLGVPIGEREDYNILQSGDTNYNIDVRTKPVPLTDAQRAQLYLSWKTAAQGKVDLATATEAAHIAASQAMNPYLGPKSWAGLMAAPSVQAINAQAAPGAASSTGLASIFSNKWLMIILIGAGLGLLLFPSHPKK
jgi:hypothetical protein